MHSNFLYNINLWHYLVVNIKMLIFIAFCISVKAAILNYDYQLDFKLSDFYLFLTDGGVDIRNSSSTENDSNIVYSKNDIANGTIFLNLSVSPDPESIFLFKIASQTCTPFNLDICIENLDPTVKNLGIYFYESWECINNVDIFFHIESSFIYFRNNLLNVNLKVLSLNDNQLIASIPSLNRKKYVICYENFDCSKQNEFSIQSDEIYLSSINEIHLEKVISGLILNSNLDYFRIIYNSTGEIPFPKLPMNQIQQLELIGLSNQNPVTICLNDNIDTQLIPKWIIQNAVFSTETSNLEFYFHDFFIKDTENVFPSDSFFHFNISREYRKKESDISPFKNAAYIGISIFEIFPELNKNGDIKIFVESDEITIMNSLSERITTVPFLSTNKTIILIQNQENKENNKIQIISSNPGRSFSFQIENSQPIPIEFCNWSGESFTFDFYTSTINDISITLTNSDSIRYHHYNIDQSELFNKYPKDDSETFSYLSSDEIHHSLTNIFSQDFNELNTFTKSEIFTETSTFSQSATFLLHQTSTEKPSETPKETPSKSPQKTPSMTPIETPSSSPQMTPRRTPIEDNVTEIPIVTTFSDSSVFEMSENGFFEDESGNLTTVNRSQNVVSVVTFTQDKIEITESSEFSSTNPLYFVAYNKNARITLAENVTHSNIGVSSQNSPIVILSKSSHPLSFVNNEEEGSIEIDFTQNVQDDQNSLNLNQVNNKEGSLSLTVPSTVKAVSFSSITMSKLSYFSVSKSDTKGQILELDNENEIDNDLTVVVRDLLNVTFLSDATLKSDIEVTNEVSLFDDSSLTLDQMVNFSEDSYVKLIFRNLKQKTRKNPLIRVTKPFDSVPSRVVLSSDLNGELIDVTDLAFIEAKNFTSCEIWRQKFAFEKGRIGDIDSRCELLENETLVDENITVLYLSVREAAPNREEELSVGAIIGIAAGCVTSVLFIVLLTTFLSKKGHSTTITTEVSSEQEDSIGI